MNRLTQKRVNGIKTGYWSAGKKEDLVVKEEWNRRQDQ